MPAFSVSYSEFLVDLVRQHGLHCDAVEVGPFFSLDTIRRALNTLPGWRFELHASYLGLLPFTRRRLESYLALTQSRWISCHIRQISALELQLALRWRIYLPLNNPELRKKGLIAAVRRLKKWVTLPVILENMPCSHARHRIEVDPQITSEILEVTGCDLLLDLAHARVGAQYFGLKPTDYLKQLPLRKVRQIHLSGPRSRGGTLFDAHETMSEEDYSLFEWALSHTDPEEVTLEYFRDRDALQVQIERIRTLLH